MKLDIREIFIIAGAFKGDENSMYGGSIILQGGKGSDTTNGAGGLIKLRSGDGMGKMGKHIGNCWRWKGRKSGGFASITGGLSTTAIGGEVQLFGGAEAASQTGGHVRLTGGSSTTGQGGDMIIKWENQVVKVLGICAYYTRCC